MLDSLIPVELAVAPNPLGLPSNLKLMTVPIDAYTCFELWMPEPHGRLLAAEAMLLRSDRARLEEICAKLTDLLGAVLVDSETPGSQFAVDSWYELRHKLHQTGTAFDAIAITYVPQVIYPSIARNGSLTAWTLQQSGWEISFLALKPGPTGFQSTALPLKMSIAFGQAITKLVKTATFAASQPSGNETIPV